MTLICQHISAVFAFPRQRRDYSVFRDVSPTGDDRQYLGPSLIDGQSRKTLGSWSKLLYGISLPLCWLFRNDLNVISWCYFHSCRNAHGNTSTSIDQSHRYGRHQAACREPAGSYDKTTWTAICFEHKTQYLLIRAPYTRIVVFWHISNIPPMISQSQISCNTPTFYIATICVKYCYTTGSWLL